MKKIVGMILAACLLASCLSHEGMVQDVKGYDAKALKNGAEVQFSKVNFAKVQDKKHAITGFPRKVVVAGDNVFIKTDNQLLRFSKSGKFRNLIGHRGHGRGEYVNLSTFYIESNKTIVVVDSYKGRLMRYGMDGIYKDEIKVGDLLQWTHDACLLGKDSLFVNNYVSENMHDVYGILNLKNKEMSVVAQTKLSTNRGLMPIGRNCFSAYQGNVKYVMPFDDKVYDLEDSHYQYLTKQTIISEDKQEKVQDFSLFTYKIDDKNFTGFTDIFEINNYLLTAFSDWEYTLLDKRTNTCRRYSYKLADDLKFMPIVRIVATDGNQLVGIVNTDDLKNVKTYNRKDKNLEKLMSYRNEKDTYLLLFYDLR